MPDQLLALPAGRRGHFQIATGADLEVFIAERFAPPNATGFFPIRQAP